MHKVYNLPVNSMRIFNCLDLGKNHWCLWSSFGVFKQSFRKTFTVIGNGKQSRDFIFVSDVDAFQSSHNQGEGEIFNLEIKPQSINKLVKLIKVKLSIPDTSQKKLGQILIKLKNY